MAPAMLFYDGMSQPSRALVTLIKMYSLDVELKYVSIVKGQHRQDDFKAINPMCRLPYLVDGDVHVKDSMAAMIYLCRNYNLPSHWYPSDIVAQAKVNSVLGWHGSTLRAGSSVTVMNRAILAFRGIEGNDAVVEGYALPTLRAALATINDVWLASTDYVAGDDISIADLQLACEIDMLRLMDGSPKGPSFDELMAPVPKTAAWLARVHERCGPVFAEVSAALLKSRDAFVKAKKARM